MKRTRRRPTQLRPTRGRRLGLETLEVRRVLDGAAPWHNDALPLDTNNDSQFTPADALVVVNRLLLVGSGPLPAPSGNPDFFYDTNADNMLSPVDALRAINGLLAGGASTVVLDTLMPFTIDLTPRLKVIATGDDRIPDGTPVYVDVDLNNDGVYLGNEIAYATSSVYDGLSEFALGPALPANDFSGPYSINMRARLENTDGVMSSSMSMPVVVDTQTSNALENYVNAPDATYSWSAPVHQINGPGYTYYVLPMTSQTWRSGDVNDPVWDHWMRIVVPDGLLHDTAVLFIGGGSNTSSAPIGFTPATVGADRALLDTALANGVVTAELKVVPNESVYFFEEGPGSPRSEDEIIAYTLDQYMRNLGQPGNETWPLLLPMVKSAVRAMDTIEAFVPGVVEGATINGFFVSGYSKRGWTTWLTAAVDDRVRAIIPAVFDNPNQGPQMVHHVQTLGSFSLAVQDYTNLGIFERIQTPEAQLLSRIVDPYRYFNNGRFDIPKLVMNSAGDPFFVSDSSQFYFDDLPGDVNYMRYFPNTGHGLNRFPGQVPVDAVNSTVTFVDAVLNDRALPEFSWTVEPDGTIAVQTTDTPLEVKFWRAINRSKRDFRRDFVPQLNWFNTTLVDQGGGTYSANMPTPETGAVAYLIELTFASAIPDIPYVFTTDIKVKSPIPLAPWPYPPPPAPLAGVADGDQGTTTIASPAALSTTSGFDQVVPLFALPEPVDDPTEQLTSSSTTSTVPPICCLIATMQIPFGVSTIFAAGMDFDLAGATADAEEAVDSVFEGYLEGELE